MKKRAKSQLTSQYRRTMRDVALHDRGDQAPLSIKVARTTTEMQLDEELRRVKSVLNVGQVTALIFESAAQEFRSYVDAMLTAFDRDVDNVDESLLRVIQDAWNYFPHRFLDGRCPAEVFDELAGNKENV